MMMTVQANHDDALLIEEVLEFAAERCEDPAPLAFARFFERCPESRAFFTVLDPTQPPLGCGQMFFEVIQLLRDSAEGKPYVLEYMHQIATEHADFHVNDHQLYEGFLVAVADVMAELLGAEWTPARALAWSRQSEVLLQGLPAAASGSGCPHMVQPRG
jgi:hypothetical protein